MLDSVLRDLPPGRTICCSDIQICRRNGAPFQRGFELVLESLPLSSRRAATQMELAIKDLPWSMVWSYNMAQPPQLMLHHFFVVVLVENNYVGHMVMLGNSENAL